MTVPFILAPMFVLVLLTFVLMVWMSWLRFRDIRQGLVPPQSIALREPNWPERTRQIMNAFHNQLELPLLFYVLTLLMLITHTADVILLVLSWLFVLTRLAHVFIHITSNRVDQRMAVFGIGAIALALMWIIDIARILLF